MYQSMICGHDINKKTFGASLLASAQLCSVKTAKHVAVDEEIQHYVVMLALKTVHTKFLLGCYCELVMMSCSWTIF